MQVVTNRLVPLSKFKDRLFAFDTEATGLSTWKGARPFTAQILGESGQAFYFEFEVDPLTRQVNYKTPVAQRVISWLSELFSDTKRSCTIHHAKFDLRQIDAAWGIRPRCMIHDTLHMSHAINSVATTHALKPLAAKYVDIPADDEKELRDAVNAARRKVSIARKRGHPHGKWRIGKDGKGDYWLPGAACRLKVPWAQPHWADICKKYAIGDVYRGLYMYAFFQAAMEDPDMVGAKQAYEVERRLLPVVYDMETRGLRIRTKDNNRLLEMCRERAEIHRIELVAIGKRHQWETVTVTSRKRVPGTKRFRPVNRQVRRQRWKQFNPRSSLHVAKLIQALGIVPEVTTASGLPSAQGKYLIKYLPNTAIEHLLKYRAYEMTGTRCFQKFDNLKVRDHVVPGNWCLHPDIVQVGPKTRRLACKEPNLMGINSRSTGRSFEIVDARGPIGPRDGYRMLLPDYEQMEVIIFADIADEPNMIAAIKEGRDIHTATTNKIFGGKGNLRGYKHIAGALCLDGMGDPSEHVLKAWKTLEVKAAQIPKMRRDENAQIRIGAEWLRLHKYDMVEAEAAIRLKKARNRTKLTVFTKLFGGGYKALAIWSGMTDDESRGFLRMFDEEFPRIIEYGNEIIEFVREHGYILDAYGDRISVNIDMAYQGINYTIQGSAAGKLKRVMVRLHKFFKKLKDCHLLMSVHDELMIEARKGSLTHDDVCEIREICEGDPEKAFRLRLPCKMAVVEKSWNEKRPYEGGGL